MINKNIAVAIAVVVVISGAFLLLGNRAPSIVDAKALGADESELATIQTDIDSFAKNEVVLNELDLTLNDVAETSSGITDEESIDSISINREADQIDISSDLAIFNSDYVRLQEFDQIFDEALR